MRREDLQEWAEAYGKEYQGFIEQGTLKIARPEKGAKVLDTTTRCSRQTLSEHFGMEKLESEMKRYIFALRTGGQNQFLKDMPCC